jgi:hypothetical protein
MDFFFLHNFLIVVAARGGRYRHSNTNPVLFFTISARSRQPLISRRVAAPDLPRCQTKGYGGA